MRLILERLKNCKNRQSTNANYHAIWKKFNCFVMSLDIIPKLWEDRVSMYCASLIKDGIQSSTLRSYISTIKCVLLDDNYPWQDELILICTLTRACRYINDRVRPRFPIYISLLEQLLFELQCLFDTQPYLVTLYKAYFLLSYYGLFRPGELATGSHAIKACNVHIGLNKNKMLFILYTSKSHGCKSRLQQVKITTTDSKKLNKM